MNTTPDNRKPFYKSLTIQGNAICFVGFAWLVADLLVKPAEMLISHGRIQFVELIPSTVMVLIGSISGLWGRFRKGDILVELPKPKASRTFTQTPNPVVPYKVESSGTETIS